RDNPDGRMLAFETVDGPLDTLGHAVVARADVADYDCEERLVSPCARPELAERLAGDPARCPVVRGVERRIGHGEGDRQHRNVGRVETYSDLRVRRGVVVVLGGVVVLPADVVGRGWEWRHRVRAA